MINNFEIIKEMLSFESKDDFYFLQVLQRKKENPQLGSNSRVIKTYTIYSLEFFEKIEDEVIKLCEVFNARAMIDLNKRSYEKTAFKTLENIAGIMSNRHFDKVNNAYNSACGQGHNDSQKKWILDIDEVVDFDYVFNLNEYIEKLGGKTLTRIPSKNGSHIITTPFRLDLFKKEYPEIEVHKNNPTNLYIS